MWDRSVHGHSTWWIRWLFWRLLLVSELEVSIILCPVGELSTSYVGPVLPSLISHLCTIWNVLFCCNHGYINISWWHYYLIYWPLKCIESHYFNSLSIFSGIQYKVHWWWKARLLRIFKFPYLLNLILNRIFYLFIPWFVIFSVACTKSMNINLLMRCSEQLTAWYFCVFAKRHQNVRHQNVFYL